MSLLPQDEKIPSYERATQVCGKALLLPTSNNMDNGIVSVRAPCHDEEEVWADKIRFEESAGADRVLALSEQIPRDLSLISKSLRVVIAQIFDFGSLNGWTDGRRDF